MLRIKNISKEYRTGNLAQKALDGVSLSFRDNEFVSVLGPSGSGKTTLLNIVGGLDRYDSGDLVINDVSTKDYSDRDWDSYRNHTIGFVFQSYNLIPHQTVLANVELALTIGGISGEERRARALRVLEEVGLAEQAHKKPNQMSGGQMQRVAIARALVNNPDILLADEPTGALDTETSLQVMELLREVARERLVIMVTHNPELAEAYSTRIVRLKDGKITGDTHPFMPDADGAEQTPPEHKNLGKASMSLRTALSLSFHNLLTKKGRTILTAFAGSIGIIGIALILSLSAGFQNYIDKIQEDTLTSYPLTITAETADTASMLLSMASDSSGRGAGADGGSVGEKQYISSMFSKIGTNNLTSFKSYLEDHSGELNEIVSLVDYQYSVEPLIYTVDVTGAATQVNPSTILSSMGMGGMSTMTSYGAGPSVFSEMLDDRDTLEEQYDVLAGRWPQRFDELVLVLPEPDGMTDMMVYSLGLRDHRELEDMMASLLAGEKVETTSKPLQFTYEELMNLSFKLVDASDTYQYNSEYDIYEDMTGDSQFMEEVYSDALPLHIVGIVCEKDGAAASSLRTGVCYTKELTEYVINQAADSEIVKKQLADEAVNVFSGKRFDEDRDSGRNELGLDFSDMISVDTKALEQAFGAKLSEEDLTAMTQGHMQEISAAITTDTAPAETDLKNTFTELAVGMLNAYIAENEGILDGTASIESAEVDAMVEDYMKSREAEILLGDLSAKYMLPQDYLTSGFGEMLKGMVQGYIAMVPVNQLNRDSALVSEEMVEPLVSQFLQQEEVADTVKSMAAGLTEAVMQKEILTGVGEMSRELMETVAESLEVKPEQIASAFQFTLSEEELLRLIDTLSSAGTEANAATNLRALGYQDLDEPTAISFYFRDFGTKEQFMTFLDGYNDVMEAEDDEKVIKYTDVTGILISSVKTIVDSVSYVLIAFVSISLVVSSIMIGIITYISVLERTKEIGVLRAIGASKGNISSIFNAETFIVGLCSGLLGILVTLACIPPINYVIHSVTENTAVNAVLPVGGAVILVILSVILTLIGGLIPSRQAAKKDPVLALRSE